MTVTLILGGGTGVVVAANVLRKTLAQEHKIILLDRKENYSYKASYPLLMLGKRKTAHISRNLQRLSKKGIEVLKAEVKCINPQAFRVQTDRESIEYDYLILSPGAEHHPETVPGFRETAYNIYDLEEAVSLNNRLNTFRGGKIVIFVSSLPITCPSAPYEIAFLLDDYFRNLGLREKIKIVLVTPETEPLAHPSVGNSIRKITKKLQIKLFTTAKVLSLNPEKSILQLDQGITIERDLFLGVPPHWGPSFLDNSGLLDECGWLEVDPYTLETRNKNIYGIGDATSLRVPVSGTYAPKSGLFAHFQAEVVARNLAAIIREEKRRFRYKGKGFCISYTGSGRALYLKLNYYKKPKPQIKLIKPLKIFSWAKRIAERDFLKRWF